MRNKTNKFVLLLCLIGFVFLISNSSINSDYLNHEPLTTECCHHELEEHHETHLKSSFRYEAYVNNCWRCHASINSNVNRRCSICGWYICNSCGACDPSCSRMSSGGRSSSSSSSSKSDNSWVWVLIAGGVIVGGYIIYKKNH